MPALGEVWRGLGALPRGLRLLAGQRRLQRLAVAPTLLSLVVLAVLVGLSVAFGAGLVERFWRLDPEAVGFVAGLASAAQVLTKALLVGVLVALSGALFFFGSAVAAEPFIDCLSAATEEALDVTVPAEQFSLRRAARDLAIVLGEVGYDVGLYGLLHLLLFAGALVLPFGQPVQLVGAWLVNAFFAPLEMISGPLCRRGWRGRARWAFFRAHRWRLLGLGAGVLLVLMIPLAGLLTLPLTVIAGAILVVDLEREGKLAGPAPTEPSDPLPEPS